MEKVQIAIISIASVILVFVYIRVLVGAVSSISQNRNIPSDSSIDIDANVNTTESNKKSLTNAFLSSVFFCDVTDATRADAAQAWRRLMNLKGLFILLAAILVVSLTGFAISDSEDVKGFFKLLSAAVLTIMVACISANNTIEHFKKRLEMDCVGKSISTAFPFFDLKNPINIVLAFMYATAISVISLYLGLLILFFTLLIVYVIIRSHVIRRSKLIEQMLYGKLSEMTRWYIVLGTLTLFAICLAAFKKTRAYWAIWLSVILAIPMFLLVMFVYHSIADGGFDSFVGNRILKFFYGYQTGTQLVNKMVHTKILDIIDPSTLWKHGILLTVIIAIGLIIGLSYTIKYFSHGVDMEKHCDIVNKDDSASAPSAQDNTSNYETFKDRFVKGVQVINICLVLLITCLVFAEEGLSLRKLF